jgi:cbb3-type cytochrome oxidase subunit 3
MNHALFSMAPPLLIWFGIWWYAYRTDRTLSTAEKALGEILDEKSR